jgi:GAF domain-containing protein
VRVEAEERRVHALMQVGRAMASTADYERALATLIRTISELLDVETAGFMLYDQERSELVLQQPAFGIDDPERIAAYHVALRDGGNAVKVFLSGRPYLTNDAPNDPRPIRRFVDLFAARTILTVPLIVEDQAIGVCHAINKRGGRFTDEDLELLSLIAPMLADLGYTTAGPPGGSTCTPIRWRTGCGPSAACSAAIRPAATCA